MAAPLGNRESAYQIIFDVPLVTELYSKSNEYKQRKRHEQSRFKQVRDETKKLAQFAAASASAAGGTLGFVVSYLLEAPRYVIAAATVGGAVLSGGVTYCLTRPKDDKPRMFDHSRYI